MAGALDTFNPWSKDDRLILEREIVSGTTTTTYIAFAPRGSLPTEAKWQCMREVVKKPYEGLKSRQITYCKDLKAPGTDGVNLTSFTYE